MIHNHQAITTANWIERITYKRIRKQNWRAKKMRKKNESTNKMAKLSVKNAVLFFCFCSVLLITIRGLDGNRFFYSELFFFCVQHTISFHFISLCYWGSFSFLLWNSIQLISNIIHYNNWSSWYNKHLYGYSMEWMKILNDIPMD